MSLEQKLTADIAVAMKAKDATRLIALRMLKTALTNRSIERGRALDPAEELQVVGMLVRQRRDSIEQFTAGNRPDLAEKERAEIAVLDTYLPPAASETEIAEAVDAVVVETGASSPKDIGRVMKAAMARLAGKTADGKKVNEAVRARLAN
ncbi:MAG: GatB/YqeY domain-containing protein [Vicinamibacterales bacterium]